MPVAVRRLFYVGLLAYWLASVNTVRGENDPAKDLGKFLAEHGYGRVEALPGSENSRVIEPMINGRVALLTIDTGCARTCITESCARSAGLVPQGPTRHIWALGGGIDARAAIVKSLTLKNYELNRTNLISVLGRGVHNGREDGLFGYDLLHFNCMILPVGSDVVLFKPGDKAPPNFDSYMIALGLKPVPLHHSEIGLYIDGELNGQPCRTVIDSGAAFSTFDLDYILKVNGGQVLSERIRLKGLDGADNDAYGFLPKNLRFGFLTLDRTELTAMHVAMFHEHGFNALFGYDLLAAHQAIIDLGHNVLWMK